VCAPIVELGNNLSTQIAEGRSVGGIENSRIAERTLLPLRSEFALFSAPELERITGMPHHLQRLWRHRGHLPHRRPYTRACYTSLELAQLGVRYRLSLYSLPPSDSHEIGDQAGRIVLLAALGLVDGACEDLRRYGAQRDLTLEFQRDARLAAFVCGILWPHEDRYLWSADGSNVRVGPLMDSQLRQGSYESFLCIDLFAMARRIAGRAGRPLVTLHDVSTYHDASAVFSSSRNSHPNAHKDLTLRSHGVS
jgi:hypothetical protein